MRVISELIAKVHAQVDGYLQVLKLINTTEFKSAELQALKAQLSGAEASFEQLELILQKIDNRSNEVGGVYLQQFCLNRHRYRKVSFFIGNTRMSNAQRVD